MSRILRGMLALYTVLISDLIDEARKVSKPRRIR
jgi:hypothetical protein